MEALALTAAVFQLADFGCKLLNQSRKFYQSVDGVLDEHRYLRVSADGLSRRVDILKAQQSIQIGPAGDHHASLCARATRLAEEALSALDAVRIRSGKRKWDCIRTAFKTLGMDKKFEELDRQLRQLRQDVDFERRRLEYGVIIERFQKQEDVNNELWKILKRTLELVSLNSKKPPDRGYEWEAAGSDVIVVNDGIGPTFPFPIYLCSTLQSFVETLRIKFLGGDLPGTNQFERGHIAITDSSGETFITKDNWNASIKRGAVLRVSFVMSRWHGLDYLKCARCRKPYYKQATGDNLFKTCNSCNLSILHVEPDVIPYEPSDIVIGMDKDVFRDHKLDTRTAKLTHEDLSFARPFSDKQKLKEAGSDTSGKPMSERNASHTPSIDLVCRNLIVKWEPIVNFVHRYIFCRCVIRLSTPSRSRFDPEQVILVFDDCPRHNNQGLKWKDYGDLVVNSEDPYFDQYGGYDVFSALMSCSHLSEQFGFSLMDRNKKDLVLQRMDPEVRVELCSKIHHEIYSRFYDYGLKLPKDKDKEIREARRLEREKRACFGDLDENTIKTMRPSLKDAPMNKELREILAGNWNGCPHWSVD
ncbi:hypothetical protein TruAng_012263 [Truncatella angustata]|nr:hypothetical protein TruAng_012263 [Truncatella angustata]